MDWSVYARLFSGGLAHCSLDRLALWASPSGAKLAAAGAGMGLTRTGIAIIPVRGILTLHDVETFFGPIGGRTSLLRENFDAALADEMVEAIVLDVDSPGGAVDGIPELAAYIRAARGVKPIIAVADTLMASAAYWLASQADEIVATPSAEVGSIGVFVLHLDFTEQLKQIGVTSTILRATNAPRKIEANPFEALSEEAAAHLIDMIDQIQDQFEKDVAAGRRVKQSAVREKFGQGSMMSARDAVEAGLADRVATLEQTVANLGKPRRAVSLRRSAAITFS